MKKIFMLATFLCAVMISSTALAASWTPIDVGEKDSKVFVDKSTIKRGIQSKHYNFSRADGFSAVIRIDINMSDTETISLINLVGFFEENGKKKYIMLESLDENGALAPDDKQLTQVEPENADGTGGTIWPKVYDFVQKNLP